MTTAEVDRAPAARTDQPTARSLRLAVLWGVVWGAITVAVPVAIWWLPAATVQALIISLIAAVYIGFAVADGRPKVIAVESLVAGVFVVLAAAGVATPWLLVVAYFGHGAKDLWQHRTRFVRGTRWWPPFCVAVDWVVAVALIVELVTGVGLNR